MSEEFEEQPILPSDEASGESFFHGMFIIPEGLDFTNSFLIIVFIVFIIAEMLYLCFPEMLKRKIESLDFNS